MVTSVSYAAKLLILGISLAAASITPAIEGTEVQQALIWLPSGVAVAGLTILGWRAVWVVFLTVTVQRWLMDRGIALSLSAAFAASTEAIFGAWLVHAFQIRRGLDRLRDVMALYLVTLATPLASMLSTLAINATFFDRSWLEVGWAGWWRMNAIGLLVVIPAALSWQPQSSPRYWLRPLGQAGLWGAFAGLIAATVVMFGRPGVSSVLLFGATPLISFAAALHIGNRGSATAALVAVLVIDISATHGIGPIAGVPIAERHVAVQILLVGLAAVSPLFGALLAERDANAARWLQSEGVGNALLRVLPDATYRLRADGTVLNAVLPDDPALPKAEELIGKHVRDIVQAPLSDRLLAQLARLHRGEATETIEYQLPTEFGLRDREVRFVMLPNGEAMSVARDITVRKRAERQLTMQASILEMIATGRKRNEVFLALVHGTEQLIPDGKIAIMLLHGDRLHCAAAPSLSDAYIDELDGLEVGVEHGASGKAAATGETVICPDSMVAACTARYRDVLQQHGIRALWSVPIRSNDGKVVGTFAIYHDKVRSPEAFEIALIERAAVLAGLMIEVDSREGLLASIHKNVNEGLFRCQPDEGFVYVTESFAELFGYESSEQLRKTWRDSDNPAHRRCLEALVEATQPMRGTDQLLYRRDGSEFWGLVSRSVSFEDEPGELICDGTVIDITERKELEDQLRQSQKMDAVGQLAGGVAHDFNNLLTAISGFAETVNLQLPEDSEIRRDIHQILEASKRAARLTRQLLAFGRRQVLSPEVLDLQEAATNIKDMICRLIGEHIQLVIEPSKDAARAEVDRGQLEQVLLNLVLNSRDAMQNGGRITIETKVVDIASHQELEPGRYAVLKVHDNGEGMPAEVQDKAFDPFFTTKGPGVGTGLGLSTVYGIVKQSGGTVTIYSQPEVGTTISVYLPFVVELPRPEPIPTIPTIHTRTGTILIVEDEPFVLELARRTLLAAGHKVILARDGREALRLFQQHLDELDLVLSDIVMPNMGGAELGSRIHEIRPDLRILFMSGYAREAIDLPSDIDLRSAFLHKPFSTTQLKEQVAMMLADNADESNAPTGAQ